MLERIITARLIASIKRLGGLIYKLRFEGCSDAPDYMIMYQGHTYLVETKGTEGKPRESQEYIFRCMELNGGIHVNVITSIEEVDSFIDELIKGKAQ